MREMIVQELLEIYASGERNLRRIHIDKIELVKGANLTGIDLLGSHLECRFEDVTFSNSILRKVILEGASFQGVNLSSSNITESTSIRCEFKDTNFSRANLQGFTIERSNFDTCDFSDADLSESSLEGRFNQIDFKKADLSGAFIRSFDNAVNFQNCIFDESNFESAIILNVNFNNTSLRDANFSEAIIDTNHISIEVLRSLGAINLEQAIEIGRNKNLSSKDFSGIDLFYCDLSGSNLENANLSDCDLSVSDLSNCNLNGANLNLATLDQTNLRGADLSNANLSGVMQFSAADIEGAIFRNTIMPDGNIRSDNENQG
jgi:uncharacterized protein YjbI with pentapeptide repeats